MGLPFIDFKAVQPVRFNLGRQPEVDQAAEDDAPDEDRDNAKGDAAQGRAGLTFLSRVNRRRLAGVKRAAELLDVLPTEGETLHCLLFGFFDLANVVLALLDKVAVPCQTLRIGTLSLSKRNAVDLAALLDAGAVRSLDVLVSDYQYRHDPEIMAVCLEELRDKRGQRVAAGRSHAKLVTLALTDGRRFCLSGSANLRTSRNAEQLDLSCGPQPHEFYDSFLAEMVTKHALRD